MFNGAQEDLGEEDSTVGTDRAAILRHGPHSFRMVMRAAVEDVTLGASDPTALTAWRAAGAYLSSILPQTVRRSSIWVRCGGEPKLARATCVP